MKVLFLNFASHSDVPTEGACIACVDDAKTVALMPIDHRMSDDQLMPAIESLLKEAGWRYSDLTNIACVVGPGGFTSLRMAVSLANILADQLQIPVAGIHLSDLYESRVLSHESRENEKSHDSQLETHDFTWFHSTKKTALFVRTFGIADSQWTEPTFVPIDEILTPPSFALATAGRQPHPLPLRWCGELIPEHQAALSSLHLEPASLSSVADTLPSFLASQKYGKDLLQPWYGRGW